MAENTPDRGGPLKGFFIFMVILPTVAILLRFWSRSISSGKHSSKGRFWWDDWVALASLVRLRTCINSCSKTETLFRKPFAIIYLALGMTLISRGLGKHVETLQPEQVVSTLRYLFITYFFYDLSITLPKCSALLFYFRIFGTNVRWLRYAV